MQDFIEAYFRTREIFAPLASYVLRIKPKYAKKIKEFKQKNFRLFNIGMQVCATAALPASPPPLSFLLQWLSYSPVSRPHAWDARAHAAGCPQHNNELPMDCTLLQHSSKRHGSNLLLRCCPSG